MTFPRVTFPRQFPGQFGKITSLQAPPWYNAGGAADPLGAWLGKGAGSKAASFINLVNPGTYDLTEIGAINWTDANGWEGVLLSGLDTGITPTSQNYTYICAFNDNGSGNSGIVLGCNQASYVWIRPNNGSAQHSYKNGNSTGTDVAGAVASGVMAIAGVNCYLNGVADGSVAVAWGVATSVFLTCRSNTGVPATQYLAGYVIAAAIWNSVLTPAQVLAVSTQMAGF